MKTLSFFAKPPICHLASPISPFPRLFRKSPLCAFLAPFVFTEKGRGEC